MKTVNSLQIVHTSISSLKFKHFLQGLFSPFKVSKLHDGQQHALLVQAITQAFEIDVRRIDTYEKGILILDALLSVLSKKSQKEKSFKFLTFLKKYRFRVKEKRLLTTLFFYKLFFEDDFLFQKKKQGFDPSFQCLIWQTFAEVADVKMIKRQLKKLSLMESLQLIPELFLHYREGSFLIISFFEEMHSSPSWRKLLQGLQRRYYDAHFCLQLFQREVKFSMSQLDEVIRQLETRAFNQVKKIEKSLRGLLHFLLKGSSILNQGLFKAYSSYFEGKYSQKQLRRFFSIFGLYDHQPSLRYLGIPLPHHALSTTLVFLERLFQKPMALQQISQEEVSFYLYFIKELCDHLEAFLVTPKKYFNGLKNVVFALPTKGKELEKLAWLPSVIKGLTTLIQELNDRAGTDILRLSEVPIFVFDHSTKELFKKNSQFVHALNSKYLSSIFHLSLKKTLTVARYLKVEGLIDTTGNQASGYGGARNSVYFLTPFLSNKFKEKKKIVHSDKEEFIHMGEDDLLVPEAVIFSDALFAYAYEHDYIRSQAHGFGRTTFSLHSKLSLSAVLAFPKSAYAFFRWSNESFAMGMKGLLSKPKFCLNLSLGGEEQHFMALKRYDQSFRQPLIHLGGSRFNLKMFPFHPLVGLKEYLERHVPYLFGVALNSSLIDPKNLWQRGILPWNERRDGEFVHSFSSFKEALRFAAEDETKDAMSQGFWKNLEVLLNPLSPEITPAKELLNLFLEEEHDAVIKHVKNRYPESELRKLRSLYRKFKLDALLFYEFGLAILHEWKSMRSKNQRLTVEQVENVQRQMEYQKRIDFRNFPFTFDLLGCSKAIGAGQFSLTLTKMLTHS